MNSTHARILAAQLLQSSGNRHMTIAMLLSLMASNSPLETELVQPIQEYALHEGETRAQALADIIRLFPELKLEEIAADEKSTKGKDGMVGMNLMPFDKALYEHVKDYLICTLELDPVKTGFSEVGRYLLLVGAAAVLQVQQTETERKALLAE